MFDLGFYEGKRVFVTGHTGFKGSWLCQVLAGAGAEVTGYALQPPTDPSLFELAGIERRVSSRLGDIRDFDALAAAFDAVQPEIVFHLAAQPLVREGYRQPRHTYEVNVMGTVNVLECVRSHESVKSFLNVTTDKVYENHEWCWGYRESDSLDGFDPYSNSKSCSELVTHAYAKSYFQSGAAVSTARAGNVIGGGDFADGRIIPDCIRAVMAGAPVDIRNPDSIRPYQHVLEPLLAYLAIAARQFDDPNCAGSYNVGPEDSGCISTGELVRLFCEKWGDGASYAVRREHDAPHEALYLKLDCSKIKSVIGWSPRWSIDECIEETCAFYRALLDGGDVAAEMDRELAAYLGAVG